jgi:hypothetical protein
LIHELSVAIEKRC